MENPAVVADNHDSAWNLIFLDRFLDRLIEENGAGKLLRERSSRQGQRADQQFHDNFYLRRTGAALEVHATISGGSACRLIRSGPDGDLLTRTAGNSKYPAAGQP